MTALLGALATTWRDVQQMRIAAEQRELGSLDIPAALLKIETALAEATKKELRHHPVYPWLEQFPGLRGVHVARLIVRIDDPRRFPGQLCSAGHHSPPDYPVGAACPVIDRDENACLGVMLPPRPGTGVRSLYKYLGLHVVNGRSPRKTKGQRADWDPIGRTAVLMPSGIADAIVRNRVEPYRSIYDAAKARLTDERGAEPRLEIDGRRGPALIEGAEVVDVVAFDTGPGLRPFQIDALARKIAAKRFIGDLLTEWKRLLADPPFVVDPPYGEEAA